MTPHGKVDFKMIVIVVVERDLTYDPFVEMTWIRTEGTTAKDDLQRVDYERTEFSSNPYDHISKEDADKLAAVLRNRDDGHYRIPARLSWMVHPADERGPAEDETYIDITGEPEHIEEIGES